MRMFVVVAALTLGLHLDPSLAQGLDNSSTGFADEKEAARRAGLPLTPADMREPAVPPAQNAATFYGQAWRLLPRRRDAMDHDAVEEISGCATPKAAVVAKGRRTFERSKQAVGLIHRAAALAHCDFPRDWSLGPALMLPEFADLRRTARWIAAESYLELLDGKSLDAVRTQALGFRIARHAAHDSMLIAYLVAVAIDNITLAGMENILYKAGNDPAVAKAVKLTVEKECRPLSLAYAYRGEVVSDLVTLELIRKGGPSYLAEFSAGTGGEGQSSNKKLPKPKSWDKMVDFNGAFILSVLRQISAAADRPYTESIAAIKPIEASYENTKNPLLAISLIMLPVFSTPSVSRARHTAHAEAVRCGTSVLVWKARNGRFPDELEQAISPVPADPFDLKPLRYRREGTGFIVYSVGESGDSDGGPAKT